MLTPEQIAHYETFGFLILRKIFSDSEANSIQSEFDAVWTESLGGQSWS